VDARHKLAPGLAEGQTRLAGHDGVKSRGLVASLSSVV
jgi:hypothetical protein